MHQSIGKRNKLTGKEDILGKLFFSSIIFREPDRATEIRELKGRTNDRIYCETIF